MPRIWSGRSREVVAEDVGGVGGEVGGVRFAKEPGF